MDILLTNDAEKVCKIIFKEYNSRMKAGADKLHACDFGMVSQWPATMTKSMPASKIKQTLPELRDNGFIRLYRYGSFFVLPPLIAHCEVNKKSFWKAFLPWLEKLISFLPFH